MCLAIPARIVELQGQTAVVEVGGLLRDASLVLLPEASRGDFVLIHAGFAISRLDEQEALETLRLFDEMSAGEGLGAGEEMSAGEGPGAGEGP